MRLALRATLLLLVISAPLLAAETAYVIPVATGRIKETVYTTTLALRNDGPKDAQCEAIYAIPNDPKGGTLRAKYMVSAGSKPRVEADVLRGVGVAVQDPVTGLILMRDRWYDPRTGTFITPDPTGYRDSANLYSFCGGDPVNCSDPTGRTGQSDLSDDRRAIAAKRLVEAAASRRAADAAAMQRANDLHRAASARMIALRRMGVDVKANDIVFLTPNLEYGVTASGRVVANPSSGRIESETAGLVLTVTGLRVASPAIGAAWRAGGMKAAAPLIADELAGMALGMNPSVVINAPRAIANVFEAQRVLAGLTRQVNAELAANPALAQTVLSPLEYAAGVTRSGIAAAQYGNAVERLVAQRIERDPALRQVFQHVGGPKKPDFTAFGRSFDITTETEAQVMRHMKRPGYGNDLIVVTYERPGSFTTFPGGQ